jgi:D-glycero-D-manno-heptose 1,7-bisphosphate phosphatase
VVEPVRAGTGGALHHASNHADDEFLLMNGDTWFDFPLESLVRAASRDPAATAVLALRTVPEASRYGLVVCDAGRVMEFQSRPTAQGPGIVNAGVYLMRRTIFQHLQPACSLETDVLPRLARSGSLAGVVADGFFLDIGVPSAYDQAQQDIPARMGDLFRAA